ncbi:MAG: hypothetical protein LBE85_07960 [Candidatus Accumulibacter sp.]|nr:hypothetical protein [Accumulibacter sp.]
MAGGAWGCPHELDGRCGKVRDRSCDPGMKGCELYGRYVFLDAGKNSRLEEKKRRSLDAAGAAVNRNEHGK